MRILGISGSKGGVGTTTVAAQLGTTLAIQGFDTLVVELNRCGGCTDILGMSPSGVNGTVSCQLFREAFEEFHRLDGLPEFRVIDARPDVDGFAEIPEDGVLSAALFAMEERPDIVIVDTVSVMEPLGRWAIGECDDVIVVVQPSGLAVRPVPGMVDLIERLGTNFLGLLCNHHGALGAVGEAAIVELHELFEELLLPVCIPSSEAIQKAAMNGSSIFWEDGRSGAARAFKQLAELLVDPDYPLVASA